MKLFGQWEKGTFKSGKWMYPNGMFYEGSQFNENKPIGEGKWVFKNGNELKGTYEQKKKLDENGEEIPEEDPGVDDEGNPIDAPPSCKFNLIWHSNTNITSSSKFVNSVE